MTEQFAVLGSPIGHSLSPQIHQAAYSLLGLDWEYSRHEIAEDELPGFLASRDESWQGFSLTMPLKTKGFELSSAQTEDAQITRLANTLVRIPGGWQGHNTDVDGLKNALLASISGSPSAVFILGSGATSKSAVLASSRAYPNTPISIAARNRAAVDAVIKWAAGLGISLMTHRFEELVLNPSALTISTVPGTAQSELLQTGLSDVAKFGTLFDIAYSPWPSALAHHWLQAGLPVVSGVEMLLQQALLQIEIFLEAAGGSPMKDRDAIIGAMRAALPAL